jgi:DNA transposition AAA+ family ATPase
VNATRRAELTQAYAQARTLWRRIEQQPVDAKAYGLSGARLAQLRKAIEDEGGALEQLSQALRETDDARLLKTAAAIKPPFARAFTAFGQPEAVGAR